MPADVGARPNLGKKEAERRVLIAARNAGAPIPDGEIAGEEPDFRFQRAASELGIELSEIMRPASSNHGILPAEAEVFHQSVMRTAQECFQKISSLRTHVNVYFSNPRGQKQSQRQLVKVLVEAVQHHRHRANPAVVLEGEELPEGFDHILITDECREWWCGEGGGIHLSEIYPEIAAKIAAKNRLVPRYRANLPHCAELWLLLFSRVTVARSVPIPAGTEEWKFPFDFDRVLWFACLENRVVEFQR
ncbi:MAG TPA: hypothetical protein VFA67_17675 [Candidatus Sulfotelmatobacter sp.]|nr:hypothetical protein [Candidatus Sulfotelmatobacter sp.]